MKKPTTTKGKAKAEPRTTALSKGNLKCLKFGAEVSRAFCQGNDCSNGVEHCRREIKVIPSPLPIFHQTPPAPPIPVKPKKEIPSKKVDKRKEKKSEKRFHYHFEAIWIVLSAYLELLRRFYAGTLTGTNLTTLKKVETYLEVLKRNWVQKFMTECEAGETKWISIAVDALGPYAYTQEWFNTGLATLSSLGKTVTLKPWPEEFDETKFFSVMEKVERTLARGTADDAFQKKHRSEYYEKFPRKQEIIIVHMVFGLSDSSLHSQLIDFYPPSNDPETLFQFCDKSLP
jgi:hypothetical protein